MPLPLKTSARQNPVGKSQRHRKRFNACLPTIQPDLPMQGGGLVHLCARGTRSGLHVLGLYPRRGSLPKAGVFPQGGGLQPRGSIPKAGVFTQHRVLQPRWGSLSKARVFTQHRVLQPRWGSLPRQGSSRAFGAQTGSLRAR